jgi:hypothetical protein
MRMRLIGGKGLGFNKHEGHYIIQDRPKTLTTSQILCVRTKVGVSPPRVDRP